LKDPGRARLVLALLLTAYIFNFLDRQIVGILGPSIQAELHLSNAEFGAIGGTAFALLYAALGIPLAYLADRTSRSALVAGSLGAFSAKDGTRLLIGVAAWCVTRAAVTTVWRDPAVAGALPVGGVLALAFAVCAIVGALLIGVWLPRRRGAHDESAAPAWPDPETRPPF